MTLPLAFHTGFLSDLPLADAIGRIRAHGYEMSELNAETLPWGPAHIGLTNPAADLAALRDMGPFSAFCAHHRDLGSPDADRCDAAIAWTREMIAIATDLGIDVVHVIPGDGADLAPLHRTLAILVEDARAAGRTLALEPIVGRCIGTAATALAAIAAAPGLKINFDPSHLHPMGDDVSEAARRLAPHIVHVHLKDVTGTAETFRFVPIGTGEIDLASMFRVLLEEGYRGPVSIEHESHFFAGDSRGIDEVLADGRRDFDRLMHEAAALPAS